MVKFSLLILYTLIMTSSIGAQNNPKNLDIDWKTDLSTHSVPLSEFTALLPPDGIPPIDRPEFMNIEQARDVFFEHEPVIVVKANGVAKAYPLSILMYHEIVNDQVGKKFLSITYCPLCNAAIVFNRENEFEGKKVLLDFGVSGMLRNSDLVMYDRQTESWWQQFTGEALAGELTGQILDFYPSMLMSFKNFAEIYSDGQVLSTETGKGKDYGKNPYVDYDHPENEQPRLFKGSVDDRLPAMERIINITANGEHKIYPLSTIKDEQVINDQFHDQSVVIFYDDEMVSVLDDAFIRESKKTGSVTVFDPVMEGNRLSFTREDDVFVDTQTESVWNLAGECVLGKLRGEKLTPLVHGNHFAFAWFAFQPDCTIYE